MPYMQDMILCIYIKFANTVKQKLFMVILVRKIYLAWFFIFVSIFLEATYLFSQEWKMFCWVYVPQTASVMFNLPSKILP